MEEIRVHSPEDRLVPSGDGSEASGHPEPPWYETNDPAVVVAWARDYIVKDLETTADSLRSKADFIDGKASLLFDMMTAVATRLETTNTKPTLSGEA